MRLPQPGTPHLRVTALPAVALAILMTALPTPARAAAQQLSCSPASLRYGSVVVGHNETLLVAVTNSGSSNVTISKVTSNQTSVQIAPLKLPLTLAAGASLELNIRFAPTATGGVNGQVTFVSNASNSTLNLAATGSGVTSQTVTASPASLSFGNVAMGATATAQVVLTNTQKSSMTLTSPQITGSTFSIGGASFPLTLVGGQSLKLTATFKPQSTGLTGGSSYFSGPSLNLPLTGTGTGASSQLTITPATLNFGSVTVGTTATQTATLSAVGGSVTISSASSSSSQFALPGAVFPKTIPAGGAVSLNVTFTPNKNGTISAALSFQSNAADSSTSEALAGTGTAHNVSLSWIASSSSDVTGYNIYRSASKTGAYTKVNSTLDPNTTFDDATVAGGTTYYYATTAVDSSGLESKYSNQVTVVVP
jgi:hypothetical protein